jgi:hypothetical protein
MSTARGGPEARGRAGRAGRGRPEDRGPPRREGRGPRGGSGRRDGRRPSAARRLRGGRRRPEARNAKFASERAARGEEGPRTRVCLAGRRDGDGIAGRGAAGGGRTARKKFDDRPENAGALFRRRNRDFRTENRRLAAAFGIPAGSRVPDGLARPRRRISFPAAEIAKTSSPRADPRRGRFGPQDRPAAGLGALAGSFRSVPPRGSFFANFFFSRDPHAAEPRERSRRTRGSATGWGRRGVVTPRGIPRPRGTFLEAGEKLGPADPRFFSPWKIGIFGRNLRIRVRRRI